MARFVAKRGAVLFWDEHCELINLVSENLSRRLLAGRDRAESFEEYTVKVGDRLAAIEP